MGMRAWVGLATALVLADCSDGVAKTGRATPEATSADVAFEAKAEPLSSFSYDTGLIPRARPPRCR